jgi:hypothetical protein
MTDRTDLRTDDEGDARITEMLRGAYAPPAEGAYWDALESRIMAHIAEHRPAVVRIPVNWWSDLAGWAAPGLAAAALLFAAAGAMIARQSEDEVAAGYEAVTESVSTDVLPGAVQVVTASRDGSSPGEATFRYVMSH